MVSSNKKSNWLLLLPVAGAVLFLVFYYVATINYPGGSQESKSSKGFSWLHNYWCNLLNEFAIDGEPNPGRAFAIAGMLVLCLSLGWFWYCFASCTPLKKYHRISMQVSGVLSMSIAFFIFTSLHDSIINIATAFAMIALTGTFVGLYKMKWWKLFSFGLLNLLLVAINNGLYYGGGLFYLPIVQKITFGFFLLWISLVSLTLYRYAKNAGTDI